MKKIKSCIIIDDDLIFKKILIKMMSNISFCEDVKTFENGQQALKFITETQEYNTEMPDVIFLDLNMSIFDGWQFLEDFKTRKFIKKSHLFVLSSSIEKNDVSRVKTYDCVSEMLVKPLEYEDLEKVREIVFA